jgi:hypothetical protein
VIALLLGCIFKWANFIHIPGRGKKPTPKAKPVTKVNSHTSELI